MIYFTGEAFAPFGWFFWLIIIISLIWFVSKLLKRLRYNDLHSYFEKRSIEFLSKDIGKDDNLLD